MNKPQVLIVENATDFTGGLNSILRSCESLRGRFDFHFILPKKSVARKFVAEKGFVIYELPMMEIRKDLFSLLIYLPLLIYNSIQFSKLVKSVKADLIITNDLYNLLAPLYRLMGGPVPYVCYVRFRPSKFPWILVRIWSWMHNRYAASVIAVSGVVREELPSKNNVVVIGNGLPVQEASFVQSTAQLILYPANYIRGKGQSQALHCFAKVHKIHPQWRLRFVGSDMGMEKNRTYKNGLIGQAEDLGVRDAVEFADFSADMMLEYTRSGIVLNFSESESFSLTCIEGMFYGRPVLATKCGGPEEIIEHNITGVLVEVNAMETMTEELNLLIVDGEKRNKIALAAYHQVRERFSSDRVLEQLSNVYRNAINSK